VGILSVGVRPNVELARSAGIELGQTGSIAVDAFQRTSDPAIYAAGDNSELPHMVLGTPVNIPLAGPANKAGRAAGANAALDLLEVGDDDPRRLRMRGVLGTAIVRVGDQAGGCTGLTESQGRREGLDYRVLYMPGASHAGYYPGAKMLVLKILYAPGDGKLLGAQAVGGDGVDKRIDVLATALQAGMTVEDLEHLDLSYAPPFGSAKDTQVQAGFAAANELRGQMPVITPADLLDRLAGGDLTVIDVRSPREYAAGHLDGAINIPVDELRRRADEVPHNGDIALHCGVGYRSYVAQRILMNLGRSNAYNCTGGWRMLQQILAARNADR
jgi:rhodanese-related sulfurtransferase